MAVCPFESPELPWKKSSKHAAIITWRYDREGTWKGLETRDGGEGEGRRRGRKKRKRGRRDWGREGRRKKGREGEGREGWEEGMETREGERETHLPQHPSLPYGGNWPPDVWGSHPGHSSPSDLPNNWCPNQHHVKQKSPAEVKQHTDLYERIKLFCLFHSNVAKF